MQGVWAQSLGKEAPRDVAPEKKNISMIVLISLV